MAYCSFIFSETLASNNSAGFDFSCSKNNTKSTARNSSGHRNTSENNFEGGGEIRTKNDIDET